MKKIKILTLMLLLIGSTSFSSGKTLEKVEKVNVPKSGKTSVINTETEELDNQELKEKPKTRELFKRKIKDAQPVWQLVWNDEFDGNALDKTKWNYWENGNPWNSGNYIDENGVLVDQYGFSVKHYYLRDNVKIENGNLIIELKKEENKTINIDGKERKILYSSGAVHTKDIYNVKEGKIEMRAAMPKGIGV